MTDTTTPTLPIDSADITPPPEVQAALDSAYENGHDIVLGAATSIRIVDKTGVLVTEVLWPQAGEWARRGWQKITQGAARGVAQEIVQGSAQ